MDGKDEMCAPQRRVVQKAIVHVHIHLLVNVSGMIHMG
jgi:hypothetical protein